MIYSNFTGRVAKKAKVIDGVNGQFLSIIRKTKCLQVFKRKAFFRKTKSPLSISFELRLNIN